MTKDVLVSVRGAHIADGETNNLEVITAGSYYFKNGKHYIIYDEILEGEEGSIRNTIKANADSVDMIKGGDARAHMIFQENRPNVSCYVTPYGQMIVGVTTDRIKINEGPDHLKIQIDYTLELNYEQTSQSHIEIDVKSKATAKLNLKEYRNKEIKSMNQTSRKRAISYISGILRSIIYFSWTWKILSLLPLLYFS